MKEHFFGRQQSILPVLRPDLPLLYMSMVPLDIEVYLRQQPNQMSYHQMAEVDLNLRLKISTYHLSLEIAGFAKVSKCRV